MNDFANKRSRKSRTSRKLEAPNTGAESGREYRDAAEVALATAAPGELRDLVLLFASHADGLAAKVFDRNAAARLLLGWGKGHDRGRQAYFQAIKITHEVLRRALTLPLISDFEQREELLKLAANSLARQVAIGCADVTWPDESLFPIKEPRAN